MNEGYSICLNRWSLDKEIKNELGLLLIISSLCAEKGYCYASNQYLANLFDITEVSVSSKISKLEKKGYIKVDYKKRGCQVVSREIRLKNILIHDLKSFESTIKNNFKENNISNNITSNKNIYNIYGTYKRIKLTEKEYKKLVDDFGEEFIKKQIELLDEYVESNNNKNKYSNFNLVLRKSIREHWFQKNNEILPKWFDKEMKKEEIDDDTKRIVAEIEGTQADNNKLW